MGAVKSKEGYNFQGKTFCKEIFHFFQKLMMGYQPISKPTPPPPLTLSLFDTF